MIFDSIAVTPAVPRCNEVIMQVQVLFGDECGAEPPSAEDTSLFMNRTATMLWSLR